MLPGGGIGPECVCCVQIFKYIGALVDFEVVNIFPNVDNNDDINMVSLPLRGLEPILRSTEVKAQINTDGSVCILGMKLQVRGGLDLSGQFNEIPTKAHAATTFVQKFNELFEAISAVNRSAYFERIPTEVKFKYKIDNLLGFRLSFWKCIEIKCRNLHHNSGVSGGAPSTTPYYFLETNLDPLRDLSQP